MACGVNLECGENVCCIHAELLPGDFLVTLSRVSGTDECQVKEAFFTDIPEKVLYLPELAVEAVVHTDVFHLFSLLPLLPFSISLLLVEVGRVVQVELRDHIQARPKFAKMFRFISKTRNYNLSEKGKNLARKRRILPQNTVF